MLGYVYELTEECKETSNLGKQPSRTWYKMTSIVVVVEATKLPT
jgi:hypothetical protein